MKSGSLPASVELVRWPTLLQPWVEAAQRSPVDALPWSPACAPRTAVAGALRIVGLEAGSLLRPAPGQTQMRVNLQAIGAQDGLTWLLNGQVVGHSEQADRPLRLSLARDGAQALTAMDGRGRYAQLRFSVVQTGNRP